MPHQQHLFAEPTNAERLLRALDDKTWHSTRDLVRRVGHTFAVTKFKLISNGYRIERKRHHYEPEPHKAPPVFEDRGSSDLVPPASRSSEVDALPRCARAYLGKDVGYRIRGIAIGQQNLIK